MRMLVMKACGVALLGLAGAVSATFLPAGIEPAMAGPRKLESDHHSVLRIANSEAFPIHRSIRIGRNKSMMIELPREVRDVVVSDPKIVDAVVQTSSRVFLMGRAGSGEANVFFFDANGERMMTLEITVETDTTSLEQLYHRLIPGSKIKVEMLNATLILTGSVPTAGDANKAQQLAARFQVRPGEAADGNSVAPTKVINMLSVDSKEQVMLKVTVAEVNRSLMKQMGVNLGAQLSNGNFGTTLLTDNALPLTAAGGLGTLPVIGAGITAACASGLCPYNSGPNSTFGNSGVNTSYGSSNTRMSSAIRMLERDGLLRTLAEPNLTTISGESARFLAGGEFPVPLADALGAISVSFKKFGVAIAFTPIVNSEDRITLKIDSEVSELDSANGISVGGLSIPGLKTRQASTTVEMPSGGALAIAGLLSDDTRQNIDGIPGLKELPVLGALFRSRDFVKKETELMVIVQPLMVKTANRSQLAMPTDGLAPASDLKANLLGHLNRVYGKSTDNQPTGKYEGDFGFIVE
jgi:pilus assembly protein CpaC